MKLQLFLAAVCLTNLAPAEAEESPHAGIDRLFRWTMEDIARQRTKVLEQEASEDARRKLPDFSQFGTPAEGGARQYRRSRSSGDVHCRTLDMRNGDSATDCFSLD